MSHEGLHEFKRCEECRADGHVHSYCLLCYPNCPNCQQLAMLAALSPRTPTLEEFEDLKQSIADARQDREDQRALRGKYVPTPGTCRVCGGQVTAAISSSSGDRLGGPKAQAHISGWSCVDCKLMYRACPPPKSPS